MDNLILLAIFMLLLLGFFLWRVFAHRADSQRGERNDALEALEGCRILLQLIAHIQQHRGMSTAYLAGDKGFATRLEDKRNEVRPLLQCLNDIAQSENRQSYPCFTPNDVAIWRHRWLSLTEEVEACTIEKSISAHSGLIATLLNWLDALGEARIELPMAHRVTDGMVRNYCHRLPHLAETLGQARATGSAVAAQGYCSAVARVRLLFLVSRAESLVSQASLVDHHGRAASDCVNGLAEMTRTRMLSGPAVDITADRYFREATTAIDAVFAWADLCRETLYGDIATTGNDMVQGMIQRSAAVR